MQNISHGVCTSTGVLHSTHDSGPIHLVSSVMKHPKGFVWSQNERDEGDQSFRNQGAHLAPGCAEGPIDRTV